jgi:hypothetical protein
MKKEHNIKSEGLRVLYYYAGFVAGLLVCTLNISLFSKK